MSGFDLTGRVAIVTGASRGLGQTFALPQITRGCCVAMSMNRLPEKRASISWNAELSSRYSDAVC